MATMSSTRGMSVEDLGGDEAWDALRGGRAAHSHGHSAGYRAEPHGGDRAEPLVGRCAGPWSLQRVCRYFDIRQPAGSRFCVHICSLARPYGEALNAGELKIEIGTGACGCGTSTIPGRCHRFPGARCRERSAAMFCASSSGCRSSMRPARAERRGLPGSGRSGRRILQGLRAPGGSRAAPGCHQRRWRSDWMQSSSGSFTPCIAGNWPASWSITGASSTCRPWSGISTERAEVFAATHERFGKMIARGQIDGLRVDHPDGLRDPLEYFERLRGLLPHGRIYVEKILDTEERLPASWPIDGTVGYDFLAKVNRLWMSDQHSDKLTSTYADFTGHSVDLGALIREKKDFIVRSRLCLRASATVGDGDRNCAPITPHPRSEPPADSRCLGAGYRLLGRVPHLSDGRRHQRRRQGGAVRGGSQRPLCPPRHRLARSSIFCWRC